MCARCVPCSLETETLFSVLVTVLTRTTSAEACRCACNVQMSLLKGSSVLYECGGLPGQVHIWCDAMHAV